MIHDSKGLKITLAAVLILSIALLIWWALKGPQTAGGYRGAAIAKLSTVLHPDLSDLGELVITNYNEYRANTVRWSAAYFGCLFGAAFLSACAGVLLKLESLKARLGIRNDLAAIMAALASQEKDAILTRIQEINEARNFGIVGKPSSARPEPAPDQTPEKQAAEETTGPAK